MVARQEGLFLVMPQTMKCSECDFVGNHKSHFTCDCCQIVLCTSCGGYSSSEEKCFPLRDRKVTVLCPQCRTETGNILELMQKNRKLKKENDKLLEELSDRSAVIEELRKTNGEDDKLACAGCIGGLPRELVTVLDNMKKEIMDLRLELGGVRSEMMGNRNGHVSYAEVVESGKRRNVPKDNKSAPALIIKPPTGQKPDKTREEIKAKINPSELKIGIKNLKDTKSGSLVLKCSTDGEIEILKDAAQKSLGDRYSISVPERRSPRVKIVGYTGGLEAEDIEDSLRKQNRWISTGDEFKIVHVRKLKSKNYCIIFMECSPAFFTKAMRAEKVNIAWGRYPIYEDLNLSRCYNCQGFHHKSTKCDRKEVCGSCSEEHRTSLCQSSVKKCNNCILANRIHNTRYETDHTTMDPNCPSTVYHMNILRSKIMYEDRDV